MPENRSIQVWRYDYEITAGSVWTAHIAGYDETECRDYLTKIIGKAIKVNSISQICRLDAITDSLRKVVVDASMPKKRKPGRPPKKQEEKKVVKPAATKAKIKIKKE
jgi:hypothetical protein